MIAINEVLGQSGQPENPTHRRLLELADRVEAGEPEAADDLLVEIRRIEDFLAHLPEVQTAVAAAQAEWFRQALLDYQRGAMQLVGCLEDRDLSGVAAARTAFAEALEKLRRSKDSIEDDWERPTEIGL